MRRRVTLVAAVLGASIVVAACSSSSLEPADAPPDQIGPVPRTVELAPQSVLLGGVEVRVEPLILDERGAGFEVSFDTHQGDLALDVAASSRLEVGGVAWDGATWIGDPPGGHHRRGELRFTAQGPATGQILLRIEGLAESVEIVWDLEEG